MLCVLLCMYLDENVCVIMHVYMRWILYGYNEKDLPNKDI